MYDELAGQLALVPIRASAKKSVTEGDSQGSQRADVDYFAECKKIKIAKYLYYIESATGLGKKEYLEEIFDYLEKHPEITILLVRDISRLSRGGAQVYESIKRRLDELGVTLVDTQSIINPTKVNALERLGFEYPWSISTPSAEIESQAAEKYKYEAQAIAIRTIGPQITYAQMGYYPRRGPFGYKNIKRETEHSKRTALVPDENEAKYIIMIFKYIAQGMDYEEVVEIVNNAGYKSRKQYKRDKNTGKAIANIGEIPLTVKQLQKYLKMTIYAGVLKEKWTHDKPLKLFGDPLVSIDLFNAANKGRITIVENEDGFEVTENKEKQRRIRYNPQFPFRRLIKCPICNKGFTGGSSTGKCGGKYPRYKCSKKHPSIVMDFRKDDFEALIMALLKDIECKDDFSLLVAKVFGDVFSENSKNTDLQIESLGKEIQRLKEMQENIKERIRVITSPNLIKDYEEDYERNLQSIRNAEIKKQKLTNSVNGGYEKALKYTQFLIEHPYEVVDFLEDPREIGQVFPLFFAELPNYDQLVNRTPNLSPVFKVSTMKNVTQDQLVTQC